nr:MAG TPA: helix-turn-helix domain protein [Caudoviricetes sp.]
MSAATLIDNVIQRLGLKNDAALAQAMEVAPPVISKMRNNRIPVGPLMILRIHEATGWPTRQIKAVIAGEGA